MRFSLLVFDWDGTLMDSAGSIVRSLQAASADVGLPMPSREAASFVIGLGLKEAMQHLFPDYPEADYPHLLDRYRHHYLGRDHEIPLFDGVCELIHALYGRGFVLAVATGKSRAGLDRALGHSGLGDLFTVTRTADEAFSKPHPAMLEYILADTATTREAALMIGDTSHDLLMAQNAGVASLGVSYGAHDDALLRACEPLGICHSIAEMGEWLHTNA
jgi:phosphoglycolate phosphatase